MKFKCWIFNTKNSSFAIHCDNKHQNSRGKLLAENRHFESQNRGNKNRKETKVPGI